MSEGYETVIGLTFGNTTSSIAYEKEGKVEVIANQDGDRAIPSIISYTGSDEWHGNQAKAQLIRNAQNTVTNFRDFIGIPYEKIDPTFNHASAHPVDKDGVVAFKLQTKDDAEPELLTVNEVAVRHLDRLRDSAADYIGKKIDGVVVTVPTDFTEEQKKTFVEIAAKADLKVMQIINEPTAALLGHVAARSSNKTGSLESKVILIVDVGGTRTDGAIITNRGGMFNVIATHHDTELGGYYLDEALAKYFAKEFEKKHKIDPFKEPRAVAKLFAESENVKKTLSNTSSATFAVESLSGGFDFHASINRFRFETTARPVFSRISSFVEHLVKSANLDVLDIDEVLIAGGSGFVPKVASTIAAVFDESVTNVVAPSLDVKAVNPNELAVRGAALQASLIAIYDQKEIDESLQSVVTVAPHTVKPIGVLTQDPENASKHIFVSIVDSNTPIPYRTSRIFNSPADAESVLIGVYEGEPEIKVTLLEKPAKTESAEADEEDSWDEDEDDEPEEVRSKLINHTTKLAEAGLKGITKGSQIEVLINITRDLKLQVAAREVKQGGVAIRGELAAPTLA
ncbi:uncharacterized protein SAPINGB_P005980 [Magnusiomyces paraingens]|uniref:Uncharacterized protein n=1 Tax=Magnusiomyces paraingens TaxID=2606893 RepID=A0A5E8C9T1_9ASCO|nr:uncharacterized protein SAPINGB_P005980 [Saprochaete ingens]VVT57986.1 unnamed protein product [Saprochaete ingens]